MSAQESDPSRSFRASSAPGFRPARGRRAGAALALLALLLGTWAQACPESGPAARAAGPQEFSVLDEAQQPIDLADVDLALLSEAVLHETNRRRVENGLEPLAGLPELDVAACRHAAQMIEGGFFAHRNPGDPARATPLDRARAEGLEPGFIAENIGQVFALDYESGSPVFVREGKGGRIFSREPGGEPLGVRSPLELAVALLDSWMASPGHRENVLHAAPSRLGAGCRLTEHEELGMPMFFCVQLFFSHLGGG